MAHRPEHTSYLSVFLKYADMKTQMTAKSMGSLDSKMAIQSEKASAGTPKPYEIRSGYNKAENMVRDKYPSLDKLLKTAENKSQRCRDWLVDFTVENVSALKKNMAQSGSELKGSDSAAIMVNHITKSPLRNNVYSLQKSPNKKSSPLSVKALQASPSQNLRQRVRKDSKSLDYGKRNTVKGIRFHNTENIGMRMNLRVRKRKLEPEPSDSDSDSEISFKSKPKRRRIHTPETYKMAPLKASVRKHEKAVKGLQLTITEKRALKRKEKLRRLNTEADDSLSPSKRVKPLRMQRKRKHPVRSSPRLKTNQSSKTVEEVENNINIKRLRRNLKTSLDSPLKRRLPVVKRRQQKVRSKTGLRMHVTENSGLIKCRGRKQTTKTETSLSLEKVSQKRTSEQRSSSLPVLDRKSPTRHVHQKTSPMKRTDLKPSQSPLTEIDSELSPMRAMDKKSSSPVKQNLTTGSQEDSPSEQKSALTFSSLAGTSISRPLSYRLTASPKVNGLPAVLSLNTLSGIPHKIQGSTFSSVRPGFGATSISGSQSLPVTPTPSTSEMGFFRSASRPNSLSFSSDNNSPFPQVVNNNTSSQSALDSFNPNISANSDSSIKHSEKLSQFTKLKEKRTLAETVDMLRHSASLNGMSALRQSSFNKKALTPSDDHSSRNSSRNSSRSDSPTVTPIKSEVLTPSCTPCSTPKKSPSCSPAPSLDRAPAVRLKADQKYLFRKGNDVLAQWHDGLYYLGNILKIDERSKRCLLRYEDNSKYWSLFKDIHRGAKDGEMICCVCMGESSEKPNEIVLCDNCGQGYHQNCHTPVVGGSEILDPDDEWCCRKCIFALTIKAGGALKEGKYAEELRKMKMTLPYNLHTLSWDAQHKTNVEQYYCYCGGPGIWYQKMIQCCRCKQWFHEACIQILEYPLLYADSFYIFVCSGCNFGQEYIKRLSIDWPDLVHIAIFNLTMERNQKYYELNDEIMGWLTDNWNALQVPEHNYMNSMQRKGRVVEALTKNKARFANGTEIRKRYAIWGLRVRVPPPRTHITLPVDGPVNDEVMKKLKVKGRRSKVFIPVACKSPVQIKHSPLQARRVARQKALQRSSLNEEQQMTEAQEEPVENKPQLTGPLLDRLIPHVANYKGHNHPFKHEIEQRMEKIETEQRTAIWKYCQSKDREEDFLSVSPDGPPVLVKEEPVPAITDMSPPLSDISEASSQKSRRRKSKTPKLIGLGGLKRSRRISSQKLSANSSPPNLEQNEPAKHEISVTKVRSAKANYLCAFDKLGYGKGLYILGKRETEEGKLDYLISWQ